MKRKMIYFFAACALSMAANAQGRLDSVKMGEANGLKSSTGALQDVLTNYLQIAAKNITSNNNSFSLKINWFALNPKDSVEKYKNDYFLKSGWQRNGELIGGVGLNKDSKVNTWAAGFNFNFLNRRDVSKVYLTRAYVNAFQQEGLILDSVVNTYYPQISLVLHPEILAVCDTLLQAGVEVKTLKKRLKAAIPGIFHDQRGEDVAIDTLQARLNKYIVLVPRPTTFTTGMDSLIQYIADLQARNAINYPINDNIRSSGKTALNFAGFITPAVKKSILDFLDTQVKTNALLHDTLGADNLNEANDKVIEDYGQLLKYVGRQPLLTFGYLYSHGTGTILSSHVSGVTYLQGFGKLKSDKTGQLKASLTDTLSGNDPTGKVRNFKRNIIAFQAGYNQVLAVQKQLSVMELNIAAEGDWASNGYVKGTDRKRIYFDAYFRARLPSTPWVKLDLKYDPKYGNVFGLLNFTYNIDK